MKKLLAGVLTLAMCCAMATPVFAEGTVIVPDKDGNPDPDKGNTAVSFNVGPTYEITIPDTVKLEKVENDGVVTYEKNMTITASAGVRLKEKQTIQVTMDSDFALTTDADAEYSLPYTVKVGNSQDAIESGDVVATFTTKTDEQTSTLSFSAGNPTYAGEYKDTVTFNIALYEETTIEGETDPGWGGGSGTVDF